MKILPIEAPTACDEALETLKNHGTLIYPTETCYGLGCDVADEEAVDRIFKIKEREIGKSVLMIAHDISLFLNYIEWNETVDELARTYWPGALTIVAQLKNNMSSRLASGVIGSDQTIAFRVTSHPLVRKLTEALGRPMVSTSANLSAYPNPYDIDSIVKMFDGRECMPDLIIDAGDLPHHKPSTIVKVEIDGSKTILRQGEIVIE